MPYDDATVPMQIPPEEPTWPSAPLPRRPAFRQTGSPQGCGLAFAMFGAFAVGMILATFITAILVAPRAMPSAPSQHGAAALRLTLTDDFFNRALSASDAGSVLTKIQSHIQTNGQLTIFGAISDLPVGNGQTALIVLAPTVSKGQLTVVAISGAIGGFPIPATALDRLTASLDRQLARASAISIGGGQRLNAQDIAFANGAMTISYG
ncbi:MAG TPA: hypothetical protein VF808_11260 [Ktedonobacterales bacterium]